MSLGLCPSCGKSINEERYYALTVRYKSGDVRGSLRLCDICGRQVEVGRGTIVEMFAPGRSKDAPKFKAEREV